MKTRLHVDIEIDVEVVDRHQLLEAGLIAYEMHEAEEVPSDGQHAHRQMYATDPAAAFSLLLDLALPEVLERSPV